MHSKLVAGALIVLAMQGVQAADTPMKEEALLLPSAEIRWKDAPKLGKGAKMAVLEGKLDQAEPFTFRAKLPPRLQIAPHTHPLWERVTVLSGTFHFGLGDKFDRTKARAYPVGSLLIIPPGQSMFAYAGTRGATIQVHGTGPWGIDYLEAGDK
ncbi:cupin domain-containing protein [Crenobacter cavernae]|uniref:Cupin n=1 Tax=Crenobacter cavernae TaxID=2290923 RepID=A0ABY0FB26_9NEIS|nr:cupin domain-containing protein [Crenobacter cavernae]RXZ43099.1 cupin [Crenobacter cavernae]